MSQVIDLDDYVASLAHDPPELDSLYRDLLIGVTKFFRDYDAFDRLERRVLPELRKHLSPATNFASGWRAVPPAKKRTLWRC